MRLEVRVHIQETECFTVDARSVANEVIKNNDVDVLSPEHIEVPGNVLRKPGNFSIQKGLKQIGAIRQTESSLTLLFGMQSGREVRQQFLAVKDEERVQRVHHLHRSAQHDNDFRCRV